jgi:glucokinase
VPTPKPAMKWRWIFEQQAMALGRLFTIAANYTDRSVYFVSGGVVESTPAFRDWFMAKVREHTVLREEQAALAAFAVVPDLDMAGARGAALAAHVSHQSTSINLIHQ